MATLEEGLISYLTAYAGLAALIGTRVHVMDKPRGVVYPCLTFQRIDTPRIHTHGTSGASGDLAKPRVQFDAWASTSKDAKAITDQLRAAINGKKGAIGTAPYQVTIRASLVDAERPFYDEVVDKYRSQSDYIIWHEE